MNWRLAALAVTCDRRLPPQTHITARESDMALLHCQEANEHSLWTVYRQDDTGNQFVVQSGLGHDQAEALVMELESRGHKQHYWAALEPSGLDPSHDITNRQ